MNTYSTGEFLQGFLDEAGEHLTLINQALLRLETSAELDRIDLIADLLRSFHTLKGLFGMASVPEGSQLSHALETVLQPAQRDPLSLEQPALDMLFKGTRLLADIVDSVRQAGASRPDPQPLMDEINRLLAAPAAVPAGGPGDAPEVNPRQAAVQLGLPGLESYPALLAALTELDRRRIAAAVQARQHFILASFTPSSARAGEGKNVDLLRQQLLEQGVILKAAPAIEGQSFRFLFLVASQQPLDLSGTIADEAVPLVNARATPRTPARVDAPALQAAAGGQPVTTVRVELARLDDLMRSASDLVLLRARLGDLLARAELPKALSRDLAVLNHQFGRSLRDLRRSVLRARMVPLGETFSRMPLVVRDLARATQKDVRLVIEGETTEIDKALVERLLDPLIHLVRNAIIHGIETPAERLAAGKPAQGTLTLRGVPQGDHILVEIGDDGRGLDLERIAAKAVELGWLPAGQPIDSADALEMISHPGFSTRRQADLASGRGIGLDVVQQMVRSNGGQLSLESTPGQGSTFCLRLPLSLVIMNVVMVQAAGQMFAVPQDALEHIIEVDPAGLVRVEAGELLPRGAGGEDDDYYVVYRLADFARLAPLPEPPALRGAQRAYYGLVSEQGRRQESARAVTSGRPLLLVDAVREIREVVVQTLADPLALRPGIAGATEMGNGQVVLILDLTALFNLLKKTVGSQTAEGG